MFDAAGGRTKETNWLRDSLPWLLEQDQRQKIYTRVISYGYTADVWLINSVADIDVPVNNLLTYLESERGNVRSSRRTDSEETLTVTTESSTSAVFHWLFFGRTGYKTSKCYFILSQCMGKVDERQAIIELANSAIGRSTATEEYNFPAN